MAGISQSRHTMGIFTGNDFPAICLRCGELAEKGFSYHGATVDVAFCKPCVPWMIADMIFDTVREENFHVTWDAVKPLADAVERRLRRISKNLDGDFLNGDDL